MVKRGKLCKGVAGQGTRNANTKRKHKNFRSGFGFGCCSIAAAGAGAAAAAVVGGKRASRSLPSTHILFNCTEGQHTGD